MQMLNTSFAQTTTDSKAYKTEKAVVVYAGGGISYFIGKAGTPTGFEPDIVKLHPMGSLRVMWHPGNLLHYIDRSGTLNTETILLKNFNY